MPLARLKVIDCFSRYGVGQAQIEQERGRPIHQWTPRDIVDLRGMATALKEGRVSAAEIFAAPQSGKPLPFLAGPVSKGAQPTEPDPLLDQVSVPTEGPPKDPTKPCPDRDGKPQPVAFCNNLCTHRQGCPEWD